MDEKKLGGIPIEFYKNREIEKIIPRFKGATRRYRTGSLWSLGNYEIFKTNIRLDSYYNDVLRMNDVPLSVGYDKTSPWSDLKNNIKWGYLTFAQLHKTHFGRYPAVKPLFNFLLYKYLPEYPYCMQRINPIVSDVDASENAAWRILNPDKYKNAKKILSKRKNLLRVPYVVDLSLASVLFAYGKWQKSFIIPDRGLSVSNKSKQLLTALWLFEFLRKVMWQKGNALRERVAKEGLTDKRGIYPCMVIYAIRSLEREANVKILKTNKVLSEIWGISHMTFNRRMSELLSIDC